MFARTSTRVLLAAGLGLALAGSAHASNGVLVPVSQARSVQGSATASDETEFDSDSDSDAAADFDPFVSGAAVTVTVFNALGSGGGTQNSTILDSSIHLAGSSFANGEGYSPEGFGSGSGSSSASVTFDLLCEIPYTLAGSVAGFDNGGASMSLVGPGGTVFSLGDSGNSEDFFDESGMLAAGQYTLSASTSGSAFGGGGFFDYASGSYDVNFVLAAVPAPAVPVWGRLVLCVAFAAAGYLALRALGRIESIPAA